MPLRTVLTVHNFYRQPGGEDHAFTGDAALLEAKGHSVVRYEERNTRIESGLTAGLSAIWNHSAYRRLRSLAQARKPDVAHFHNTFPLISPAGLYAIHNQGVPVVQELHNFRLLCPAATLNRNGTVCEECIEKATFFPALRHRCYRKSLGATAVVAASLTIHRAAQTWRQAVDIFIAPSAFVRQKFSESGLPEDRIVSKPNLILPDPGQGQGGGGYALFAGRLSEEKGIDTLARAWEQLPQIPLRVAGDGPLRGISWPLGVSWVGMKTPDEVSLLMKSAEVLIVSSTCYETGPRMVLEAFACGLPVIGSNLGSIAERIEHRRTGLLFRPGDAQDLAQQVRWAFEHPEEMAAMRVAARREYEEKYSAERNYKLLIAIYEMAIEHARRRQREAS
jgi:glycosyltransferase involved in cell wall biosynthesis